MVLRRTLLLASTLIAAAAVFVLSQGLGAQDKNIHQGEMAARQCWAAADAKRAQKKWADAIKAYEKSLEVMSVGMIGGTTLDKLTFGQGAKNMIEFCKAMPIDVSKLSDGAYEGKAMGFGGEMTVSVTLAKGRIKQFEIKSQKESSPRQALKVVPASIMKLQTPNVGASTGATVTSYALMTATLRALQQAKPVEAPADKAK